MTPPEVPGSPRKPGRIAAGDFARRDRVAILE
jgi:hypothetical protein